MPNILIVEDDLPLAEALRDTLELEGHAVRAAANGAEALAQLAERHVDLLLSDVHMQGMDGHALLRAVKERWPEMPVLLMTAYGSIPKAVEAMREGAADYLAKPFDAQALCAAVEKYARASPAVEGEPVAEDPRTRELFTLVRRVAQSDATVLVHGESGTGKEVIARLLHRSSRRAEGPFVAINCAAIPENMLEATLFGYEKGAFTGAIKSLPGKFEQAHGGTLLLDEISEMDLALQAKLLRVLQEREVERLGGGRAIGVDVRVVATTNRDLQQEVREGRFREDLYYRLNVFPLRVPPLRERPRDIPALADRFLARAAAASGRAAPRVTEKGPVDMAALAGDVAARLGADYPGATVRIGDLPSAVGDVTMLEQVLQNLIGNAFKYSSKTPEAKIEVDADTSGAQTVYWVKDNGAGFDMLYADKLFGAFQRLHGEDEFPGTGVGLAIVKRLIERHGGTIWAEAEPGRGARFSFTLG